LKARLASARLRYDILLTLLVKALEE